MDEITVIDDKSSQKVSDSMKSVKSESWVGHLSDDTSRLDYIEKNLREIIDNSESLSDDKIKAIKQLQDLDKERTKQAMHLDNMAMRTLELVNGGNTPKTAEITSLMPRG